MTVIKAPNSIEPSNGKFTVFLAGSIEMGNAVDWQKEIGDEFENSDDVCILNPRIFSTSQLGARWIRRIRSNPIILIARN